MPRRIPIEDFFRKPDRVQLRLAPSGTHLAWLAPHERRLNVFVQDLATGDNDLRTLTTFDDTQRPQHTLPFELVELFLPVIHR